MAGFHWSSAVANGGLDYIRQNTKSICLLASTPANLAGCTSTVTQLAYIKSSVSSANFTLSSDTTTVGYKVAVSSFATIAVNATGNATCLVLYSTAAGSSGMHYHTKCSVNLASTLNSVTIQGWKITIADPTS